MFSFLYSTKFGFAGLLSAIGSQQNTSSAIAFLVAIGGISFITFFHELGHYIFARLFNVKVAEFSIGFGSVSWFPTFRDKNGTLWKFGPIPFGGYVGILTEPSDEGKVIEEERGVLVNFEKEKDDMPEIKGIYLKDCNKFNTIIISFAGPLFNFILSFFLIFFIVVKFGKMTTIMEYDKDTTHFVQGDVVSRINSVQPYNGMHLKHMLLEKNSTATVIRDGYRLIDIISPTVEEIELGKLKQKIFQDKKFDLKDSLSFSFDFVRVISWISVKNYIKLFTSFSKKDASKISGPIGIIRSLIDSAKKGEVPLFIHQIAFISILIGVFNLIPIPPLDGGQIIFTILRMIFGDLWILSYIFNRIGITVAILLLGLSVFADFRAPAIRIKDFVQEKIAHLTSKNKKTCSHCTKCKTCN